MATSVCIVCLVSNTRMLNIDTIHLLEIYEKLTDTKLHTEGENRMPSTVCYVCHRQLQKCHRFSHVAHKSNKILQDLLLNGTEISQSMVTKQYRRMHNLSMAVTNNFSINIDSDTRSNAKIIKEEQPVIKEETYENEVIDIGEMNLEMPDETENPKKILEILITEDKYYDDPTMLMGKTRRLKRNRKRRCEEIQKDEERESDENKYLKIEDVVSPNINKKEYEENAEKITKKRIWNRKNACFYCQEVVTNFSRHLLRRHPKEIEVIKYKSINDKDPKIKKLKRQAITDELRNKGNFIHNSKVSVDNGESNLLPRKRSIRETSSPSSYVTCKACLGTFKKVTFLRHFKKCAARYVCVWDN